MPIDTSAYLRQIRPIIGALKTPVVGSVAHAGDSRSARSVYPFITISRQAGVGARSLAERLVDRLNENRRLDPPWSCWDRELVEKVAAEHNVAAELVEALDESDRSWLREFLAGLTVSDNQPSEEAVYRYVATTIRALAQVGRVVLVGRGSVFITQNLPGGVHVRLVAPLEVRVRNVQQELQIDERAALAEVRRQERNREAFYARYWPERQLTSELFHLTLNAARMDEQQMVDCILPLVREQRRAAMMAQPAAAGVAV